MRVFGIKRTCKNHVRGQGHGFGVFAYEPVDEGLHRAKLSLSVVDFHAAAFASGPDIKIISQWPMQVPHRFE